MKQLTILLAIITMALADSSLFAQKPNDEAFNIMSFNIRYPNPDDGMNYWPRRKEMVASMITFYGADLIGVQEAFRSQLDELMDLLPAYQWVGLCRTDGSTAPDPDNEFSAIIYKTSRFEVIRNETFWLSEHPEEVGKKGWDAALPRIVSWAEMKDKTTNKNFFHFNTHFDHRGKEARKNSARLVLQKLHEIAGDQPVLLSGDFNARPESIPYRTLVNEENEFHVKDAILLSKNRHHGPWSTSTSGFKFPGVPGGRIDYIFVKNGVEVIKHAILSDSWGGRLPSDHLPVFARVLIP